MSNSFVNEGTPTKRYVVEGVLAVAALLVYIGVTNVALLGAIGVLFFFFVVMIGLHELGHFVMARRAGMKVSEFFIGFGPRIWSTKRGDTEYGIKALPLGGYCKIVGMTNLDEVEPADEPRAFRNASFAGKASTLVAGPASHFVLALLLMFVVLAFNGTSYAVPVVSNVSDQSAASVAGVRVGDRILAVDGVQVQQWSDLQREVRANPNRPGTVTVQRDGATLTLRTTFGRQANGTGFLGVAPSVGRQRYSPLAALYRAPARTYDATKASVGALVGMFSPSGISSYLDNFSGRPAAPRVAPGAPPSSPTTAPSGDRFMSPVGFGKVAYDAAAAGWVPVFVLLIMINIFVGLLNLVPLIPFDGGHLAIATYEAVASRIRGRRVRANYAKLMPIAIATISVLAFIFLSSLFLDVTKPPQIPF